MKIRSSKSGVDVWLSALETKRWWAHGFSQVHYQNAVLAAGLLYADKHGLVGTVKVHSALATDTVFHGRKSKVQRHEVLVTEDIQGALYGDRLSMLVSQESALHDAWRWQ